MLVMKDLKKVTNLTCHGYIFVSFVVMEDHDIKLSFLKNKNKFWKCHLLLPTLTLARKKNLQLVCIVWTSLDSFTKQNVKWLLAKRYTVIGKLDKKSSRQTMRSRTLPKQKRQLSVVSKQRTRCKGKSTLISLLKSQSYKKIQKCNVLFSH